MEGKNIPGEKAQPKNMKVVELVTIIVAVVLIILAAVVAYFFGFQKASRSASSNQVNVTSVSNNATNTSNTSTLNSTTNTTNTSNTTTTTNMTAKNTTTETKSPSAPTVTLAKTYASGTYGFSFGYPTGGTTLENNFEDGSHCVALTTSLYYVNFVVYETTKGNTTYTCFRTGYAFDLTKVTKTLNVNGANVKFSGNEEKGPGETLDEHDETLSGTLKKGKYTVVIEYGSSTDKSKTFAQYKAKRDELYAVIESFEWK